MTATVHYLPSARHDWAADAHDVLDAVEELLVHGDTADVIVFCELAVTYLEVNASDIDDPAPLVRLAQRLGDLQRRAAIRGAGRGRPGTGPGPTRREAPPPPGR